MWYQLAVREDGLLSGRPADWGLVEEEEFSPFVCKDRFWGNIPNGEMGINGGNSVINAAADCTWWFSNGGWVWCWWAVDEWAGGGDDSIGETEFNGGGGNNNGGVLVEQFGGGGVEQIRCPDCKDINGDGIEPLLVAAVEEEDVEWDEWDRGGGFMLNVDA